MKSNQFTVNTNQTQHSEHVSNTSVFTCAPKEGLQHAELIQITRLEVGTVTAFIQVTYCIVRYCIVLYCAVF